MKTQKFRTICILIITIVMLTGCINNQKTPAVVTIGEETITSAEVMIYLLQAKEEFEKVGGPEVWEIPKEDFTGGKTPEQVAKERALDNLIKDKILVKKATSLNIKINDETIEETKKVAATYYEKIPQKLVEKYKINKQLVEKSFLDFRLATEVANSITSSYTPSDTEISEAMLLNQDYSMLKGHEAQEILTYVVLKRIIVNTTEIDANNEHIPLSEEAQKEALDKINEAHRFAIKGNDFNTLIEFYSEEDLEANNNGEFRISLALLNDELKAVIENLEIEEISDVVKTEYGYQILKLIAIEIPTNDEIESYKKEFVNWENTIRNTAEKNLRQQAFNEIYEEWKKEVTIETDDELWNGMSLFEPVSD